MNGIYIENGTMHFDIPEMLKSFGIEDTEANRDLMVEKAKQAATDAGLITPETTIRHVHRHRCVSCRSDWEHAGLRGNLFAEIRAMPNLQKLNMSEFSEMCDGCPKCGYELAVEDCPELGCEDGEYEDEDGVNGNEYLRCDECRGTGIVSWCRECGWNATHNCFLSPVYEEKFLAKQSAQNQKQ